MLGLKPSRSLASFADDARASNELSEADEADLQVKKNLKKERERASLPSSRKITS